MEASAAQVGALELAVDEAGAYERGSVQHGVHHRRAVKDGAAEIGASGGCREV